MTIEELKAIIATKALVEYADDTLRDPDSLSVLEITVVSSTPDGYHWVKIEYNANNGMGGKIEINFFLKLNKICDISINKRRVREKISV